MVIVLVSLAFLASACGGGASRPQAARRVASTTTTTTVPVTTTSSTLPTAPAGEFLVASLGSDPVPYSATPGGPSTGTLASTTWDAPTVRPVTDQTADWVQLQLDTRPNGSTAWVPRSAVSLAVTPYRVEVSISQRRLWIYQDAQMTYTALVGVGAPESPTPLGTTFVDALVATPDSQLDVYGPTVLILGAHSDVFTDFDGGDGTVAIHGYPSDPASTDGVAESHGCVRASPETIDALSSVPLGSPVDIVT